MALRGKYVTADLSVCLRTVQVALCARLHAYVGSGRIRLVTGFRLDADFTKQLITTGVDMFLTYYRVKPLDQDITPPLRASRPRCGPESSARRRRPASRAAFFSSGALEAARPRAGKG
ncbi:hypothetical protein HD596_008517 [Nonomuraea jabiensis]|uniref:Uncharacterized protein n=1 Tax=Nonomuraea jabiensis TaxID=882448 RepID=A0A7W9GDT7_9ACTN|nr:hypothetical protein [Nonomuraea jabiensis]